MDTVTQPQEEIAKLKGFNRILAERILIQFSEVEEKTELE